MVVGLSTWQPDGRVGYTQSDRRLCDSETIQVTTTIGPFQSTQCGTFEVTAIALVQPLAAATGGASSYAAPVTVTVTGCPGGDVTGPAVTSSAPRVELLDYYTWTASLTHNATNPLMVKQREPVKVVFLADTTRSPAQSSTSVSGQVVLEAPTADPFNIQSASVRV